MTEKREVVSFVAPLPPRALRTNSRTQHVGYRASLVRDYQESVWCAGRVRREWWDHSSGIGIRRIDMPTDHVAASLPWEKAHVQYVWYSTHPTDEDNIVASMKPALDVIKATGPRPLGIARDDGPGVTVGAEWRKAKTRKDCRVEITVTRRHQWGRERDDELAGAPDERYVNADRAQPPRELMPPTTDD